MRLDPTGWIHKLMICFSRWPVMNLACLACRTHPSGLVKSSARLMIPGVCFMVTCPSSFHPWTAKNWMSVCPDCPVGLSALIVSVADWLSSCVRVGSSIGRPNSWSADLMHLTGLHQNCWNVTTFICLPNVFAILL